MRNLYLILLLMAPFSVRAQFGDTLWTHIYSGTAMDGPDAVAIAPNGDIYTCGYSYSGDGDFTGINTNDFNAWVAKLDRKGKPQWFRMSIGNSGDEFTGVTVLKNGTVVVSGYTFSSDISGFVGNVDAWLVGYSPSGNQVFQRVIGGSNASDPQGEEYFYAIRATQDGGFVAAGTTTNVYLFGPAAGDTITGARDGWIVKFDSTGKKVWNSRAYAINPADSTPRGDYVVEFHSVETLSKGRGYLAFGFAGQYASTASTDFFLSRFSTNGKLLWSKIYGSTNWDEGYKVLELPNGNYLLGGFIRGNGGDVTTPYNGKYDMWFLEVDTTGSIVWSNTEGGAQGEKVGDIALLNDSTAVLVGRDDFEDASGPNATDGALVRINLNQQGRVDTVLRLHGNSKDLITGIARDTAADDLVFVVASSSNLSSDFFNRNQGSDDVWVVRMKGDNSKYSQLTAISPNQAPFEVRIGPNPANVSTSLFFPPPLTQPGQFRLLDATGRIVRTQVLPAGQSTAEIGTQDLPEGLYHGQLQLGDAVYVHRLVVKH